MVILLRYIHIQNRMKRTHILHKDLHGILHKHRV